MSSTPDRPIILNPEAVGNPDMTPIVQLPPEMVAHFDRTRRIDWTGPTCFMCDGTGEDFTYSGEPMTETRRDVPTGRPCRTCNGHGQDATP